MHAPLRGAPEVLLDQAIRAVLDYSPELEPAQRIMRNRAKILAPLEALGRHYAARLIDHGDSPTPLNVQNFHKSRHRHAAGDEAFSRTLARHLAAAG